MTFIVVARARRLVYKGKIGPPLKLPSIGKDMQIFPIVLLFLLVQTSFLLGQTATTKQAPATTSTANQTSTQPKADEETDPTKKIVDGLAKQNNADFELQIGIGSLIRNGSVTDYLNNANTLSATSLGWATPQYLLGVSLRSRFKNFTGMRPKFDCDLPKPKGNPSDVTGGEPKPTTEISKSTTEESQTTSDTGVTTTTTTTKTSKTTTTTKPPSGGNNNTLASKGDSRIPDSMAYEDACPLWRTRPWSGFVSLKFAPNASSVLNGYVFGGSYGLMRYLNILVGFH